MFEMLAAVTIAAAATATVAIAIAIAAEWWQLICVDGVQKEWLKNTLLLRFLLPFDSNDSNH